MGRLRSGGLWGPVGVLGWMTGGPRAVPEESWGALGNDHSLCLLRGEFANF